jgi:adenylyltransferase/sulfurtransferase
VHRYSRQIFFDRIGEKGQKRLLKSKVAIIGCGALGTVIANNLARAGIGNIVIIDRDFVELDNLQCQILFDEDDVKNSIPKAIAAVNKLKKINSTINLEAKVCDVNSDNIESFIKDVDLVLDALDNMETRFLINEACVKNNIPWVYGGVIGSIGATRTIIPNKTPCFQCVVEELPSPGTLPTCDTVGVVNTVTNVIASIETTEALKILTGNTKINRDLIFIDMWELSFEKVKIRKKRDCRICGKRSFKMLEAKETSLTTRFCGRDAIQIRVPQGRALSLERLKSSLKRVGEVSFRGYLLSFKVNSYELIIFPDARVIVKGTRDETIARSLYAKYIGI